MTDLKDKHILKININKDSVHIVFGYMDYLGIETIDLRKHQIEEIYNKMKKETE